MKVQNPKLLPPPYPLQNTNSICWFNAVVQALLSCTVFGDGDAPPSPLGASWRGIVGGGGEGQVQERVTLFLDQFLLATRDTSGLVRAPSCAAEAATLLIEMIGGDYFTRTRHRSTIQCDSCGAAAQLGCHEGGILYPSGRPGEFRARLIQSLYPRPNYTCPTCRQTGTAMVRDALCYISSVIIVALGSRDQDCTPARLLQFGSSAGLLLYRLVAAVQHAGGHYWTVCLREGGQSYILNDSAVTPIPSARDEHLANTYLAFYALIGPNDTTLFDEGSTL